MRYSILVILTLFYLLGCSEVSQLSDLPAERIEVGPGPEDMVLDTASVYPRLIISCASRRESHGDYGELISLDLVKETQVILRRYNEPSGLVFVPQGLYLDGDRLYVISHEKEPDYHPIIVYRLHGDSLEFLDLAFAPLQHSPNALVSGRKGEIYFVNDSGKRGSLAEKILRLKRASLVRLTRGPDGEWNSELMADGLGYPAGINRIGNHLFVGDAVLHRIHKFRISEDGLSLVDQWKGITGNDNIRIHDGQLLVPGHDKPFKFIKHTKDPGNFSPVKVYLIHPETGVRNELYYTDGSRISAGSTAVIHGNHLYICQVFDPFILKVNLGGDL
jgi:hypothetical protein